MKQNKKNSLVVFLFGLFFLFLFPLVSEAHFVMRTNHCRQLSKLIFSREMKKCNRAFAKCMKEVLKKEEKEEKEEKEHKRKKKEEKLKAKEAHFRRLLCLKKRHVCSLLAYKMVRFSLLRCQKKCLTMCKLQLLKKTQTSLTSCLRQLCGMIHKIRGSVTPLPKRRAFRSRRFARPSKSSRTRLPQKYKQPQHKWKKEHRHKECLYRRCRKPTLKKP